MNNCSKLVFLTVLALLAKPVFGLGLQGPAQTLKSLVASAQQAQAGHDYITAVSDYKQAIKIEPGVPELWANLGLMQQQAGDIPAAILTFQQATHLNPALYVPNLFLGIDLVRTGNAPQAISFLTKAQKINKTDPQAPLALGRAYYAVGKFPPAAQGFARAIALDPKLGAAWFGLGIARLNQVELDARKMSMEEKDSPFAGALYAESLEKQARFGEAAALYRSLLNSHPQPPCLHSALGIALLRHREPESAAAEFAGERLVNPECSLALVGQAGIAIGSGDYEQAIKLLQELWGRDHRFFVSNAAMLSEGLSNDATAAVIAYFSEQTTAIPADLHDALLSALSGGTEGQDDRIALREPSASLPPQPLSSAGIAAESYYSAGEFQECAQNLDHALVEGRADKLRLLAACTFLDGDNERALSAATALEALQPHSAEGLYWSIQANERLAVQSLARFQQLESDSPRSHVLLGDIYHQLGREDDAQAEYQKTLALEPGNPAAMLGLASAYLSSNDNAKAMETARAALRNNPEDPELNMIVGETMVAQTQYAEAEPYLVKSLNAKPQVLGHVHALIGKVYAETGRTSDAIRQLKMGESSDENGSIHYLLSRLYRQTGDAKDATAALEQLKAIKEQRRKRGVKLVEDPELSSLESSPGQASAP